MDKFSNIKPTLHPKKKAHLAIVYDTIYISLIFINILLKIFLHVYFWRILNYIFLFLYSLPSYLISG